IYLAQTQLALGHWAQGWQSYASRESRKAFEGDCARHGRPYRPPTLAEIDGREVVLVAEQGIGDILFFLRFAPALRARAARLSFAGEPRLHPLLARTGLFDGFTPAYTSDDLAHPA